MGTARKAIPDIARAATLVASGDPLAAAFVANALQGVLQDQSEDLKQLKEHLERVSSDIQALVEEPYVTGMEYLGLAAKPRRSGGARRKAIENIKNARASFMRAHGQARDQFSKARIQYQLGVCCVLLGDNEDARDWFERAYETAMDYWTNNMVVFMSQILLLWHYSTRDNEPPARVGARVGLSIIDRGADPPSLFYSFEDFFDVESHLSKLEGYFRSHLFSSLPEKEREREVDRFIRSERTSLIKEKWSKVDELILAKDRESANLFNPASPLYVFLDDLERLQHQAAEFPLEFDKLSPQRRLYDRYRALEELDDNDEYVRERYGWLLDFRERFRGRIESQRDQTRQKIESGRRWWQGYGSHPWLRR